VNIFFKDELNPFLVFIGSSIIFVISLCEFQIVKCWDIGLFGIFLKSDGIKTISGGIVSAYILYIFIEVLPRYKKEENAKIVLNKAIASILEGFFQPNIFQHEKSIRHINFNTTSSKSKIIDAIKNIKDGKVNYLQLKFTMQTADSRYYDFQELLSLAISVSPKHALFWLDITDKVRLLKDEMLNQISNPNMEILNDLTKIKYTSDERDETALFCSGLQLRVIELFESVLDWNEL
jgi:hypothetical protein